MLRTISVCEKNVSVAPPKVLTLVAATATELFPGEVGLLPVGGSETFTREVQNVTGGDLYLSFGVNGAQIGNNQYAPSCDNLNNWHILLTDGQVYNIPDCVRVCGYSVSGGKVSCVRRYRNDMGVVN